MKILIDIHCYNRKNITEICLNQIKDYKHGAYLKITNDYSTQYDNEWLDQFSDETIIYEKKLDINRLKYRSFIDFYKNPKYKEYDFIYMCDNDMYHDPSFMDVLVKIYNQTKLPVTLYNSSFINSFGDNVSKIISNIPNGHIKKGLFGGASTFLSREHINKIVEELLPESEDIWNSRTKITAWDSQWQKFVSQSQYAVPDMSYVEHYGVGGTNHKQKNSDVALNPTPYLISKYEYIWKLLD